MNFVFISPNYPLIYSHFVKALHDRGVTVLGIGDTPKANINDELKNRAKDKGITVAYLRQKSYITVEGKI